MPFPPDELERSRRAFLTSAASGIGGLALASLLQEDLFAEDAAANPLAARPPHFAPRAKACISLFMAGGPSQVDLYDPKPMLTKYAGQPLPESLTREVNFPFLDKYSSTLMASPQKFIPQGESGLEFSDMLPGIGSCADDIAVIRSMYTEHFNHHPAVMLMLSGVPILGRPTIGSWVAYGLGSESQNLPAYVVLTEGPELRGGASNWSNGFLPATYQGVPFRKQGTPILNIASPPGVKSASQEATVNLLRTLNQQRVAQTADPEIEARIASYELAFRMQSAAPELTDLSGETESTLTEYGVDRKDPTAKGFATNCLLARRLVERGVRFVSLFYQNWDHHENLQQNHGKACAVVDQPIAALLKDLKRRGLLDSTLVFWTTEFGRTPLGENGTRFKAITGRDHHPLAFSVWLAGGGVQGGQAIGRTDDFGWAPVEDRMHINDLHASILHLFGLDHKQLTYRVSGRDMRLTDLGGNVCERLLGT